MKPELNALTEKYSLAGIYNLGSPYVDTNIRFELIHLTTKRLDSVDIGIFNANMFDKQPVMRGMGVFCMADEYSVKFNCYVYELERWINEDYTPDHDKEGEYEFNTIPLSEFSYSHIAPEYYSRVAMDIRRLLSTEKTIPLGAVAEIKFPKPIDAMIGKVISVKDLKYPFDCQGVKDRKITDVEIKKNDILFPIAGPRNPYIFTEEFSEPIYANPLTAVIRCTNILPEYLYLYLNSEVCRIIVQSQSSGTAIKRINLAALREIPVVVPKESAEVYQSQVYALTHIEKTYCESLTHQRKVLDDYQKVLAEQGYQPNDCIGDILNVETAKKIRVFDEENMRSFLTADLKELNSCFRAKAYKATLILAGSILEAVLIDWLSDIDGVNYFQEEYMVQDRRTGRQKRAELIDYINEIKYIERPHWMEEASKAHEIRKKRNLVHAKLCMNSDAVNEDVCRQVIEYLKDVLKTRVNQ